MQLSFPYSFKAKKTFVTDLSDVFVVDGNKKSALTDLRDVGKFVARIVEDPRTLNQYVFVWSEERTMQECWDLGAKITGEDLESKKVKVSRPPTTCSCSCSGNTIQVSGEDLLKRAAEAAAKVKSAADPASVDMFTHVQLAQSEYKYSMHVRGDNTIANAKAAGALDARELYPDVEVTSCEDYAKDFYANPPQFYDF
jgi:hypothetical protein